MIETRGHKAAVVFASGRAYLAEKGMFHGPRVYEVYFPEKYTIGAMECPHCHERIEAPFRRVSVVPRETARVAAAPRPPAEKPPRIPAKRLPWVGKKYDIIEIEGIGETYAVRLKKAGIETTEQLMRAEPERVVQASKASPATVDNWYAMAELMTLKGVGKQFSELLVRSGVKSVEDLALQIPEDLFDRVSKTQREVGVTIQGSPLSEKRVKKWIEAAGKAKRAKK